MADRISPAVVLLGGPNGAGKSTCASQLLNEALHVSEFVNADTIASGLSGFNPSGVSIEAGRLMLRRLQDLASQNVSFAFESTLASRTFAPWIRTLKVQGYRFHLVFLWLRSPELARRRVAARLRHGGHDVPADVVRRRYARGLRNLFDLYMPLATHWRVYDNSARSGPVDVAHASPPGDIVVSDPRLWSRVQEGARR